MLFNKLGNKYGLALHSAQLHSTLAK